jgi:pimeloyl-ACP methyl ester carboxylesterase
MTQFIDRPPSTASDYDPELRKQRLHETRMLHERPVYRWAAKSAMVLAGIAIPLAHYWIDDVMPERERLANTRPEIHEIYEPTDPLNAEIATVEMVGLGNLDASETAATESPYKNMGPVWAIQYDNQGIDTQVIANLIEKKAEEESIEQLNLVGHSMGGIVALEVGAHIKEKTDIDVVSVVLDSTPINLDAVRPDERTKGQEMTRWISRIPGARESRIIRTIVEVGARRERFMQDNLKTDIDTHEFKQVVEEVLQDKIYTDDVASSGLIESQFAVITDSAAIDSLRSLAEQKKDEVSPVIVFMRPRRAVDDAVVDVALTNSKLHAESKRNDSEFAIVVMDETSHANPNQRPDQYRAAIEQQVIPIIQKHTEDNDLTITGIAQGTGR